MPATSGRTIELDELTGLPTMMYFRRYASAYVRTARRLGHKAYLIYFNLENFSAFNERYGFERGDRLLVLTSLAINASFPGFLLSRFSEDHFFLVCESIAVERCVMEVRQAVRAFGRHANVELKAGIFEVNSDEFDVGVACDRAKVACESIAHRYDKTFRHYDEALQWYMERSHYVEGHIDRAIEEGWIEVYFQPIVRTLTGKVCEFEALARWNDPRYGMIAPYVFVEVLEKAHLIHKLDAFMVRRACEIWREQLAGDYSVVPISVNLSRLDFELCDTFQMVERAVKEVGVPRQILHVEVTESALNENVENLIDVLMRFREAGYQVWLDDFGSGYSSLNTLKDYVFDVVKIDMAFLREFNTKPASRVIIASIVNMAKQLGMQTLIEGVELPEQYEFLREIGCEYVQGYLIGRPASVEDNIKRLATGELVMDEMSLFGYYGRLGGINVLSAAPFEFPWVSGVAEDRATREILPLAIVEQGREGVSVLVSSNAFERVLPEVGFSSVSQFCEYINEPEHAQARIIRGAFSAAIASGRTESVDIIDGGHHGLMRVRHVVSHDDVNALLVSFINITSFADMGDEGRLKIALQYLYSVYSEINIVDRASGVVSTIYRGNTAFPGTSGEEQFSTVREQFVQTFVHPKDRERCARYLDLSSIDERVEASGSTYLADSFRILDEDGTYAWYTSVLVPIAVEGQDTVLVCVRRTNLNTLTSIEEREDISKELLWDTLIDLVPAGIFWKDAERRFLGVNKNFLQFYDFDSVNDVLGKNDEEMGWHVETDPFKNNELRVIEDGVPVLNAHGTCISQGEVRNIVASKIPLRRNGEVVGLLGYFTEQAGEDLSQRRLITNGFNHMAEVDPLTGIPNFAALTSSAVSYKEAYHKNGPDFVCVALRLCDMADLNTAYGRSFGTRILRVVATRLSKLVGVSGAVARIDDGMFASLRQVGDVEEARRTAAALRNEVEGIHEVDGLPVRLRCGIGWALYSQSEDLTELLASAKRGVGDCGE